MEGKEIRFGPSASGLWAASTTGTSNGSVNSMHDSFTPLGGGVAMSHMMLGEVSPGGVGVGLSGLLIMAILSVFIAGLMVGRTPEYLGKKIQAAEMKMVALYILAMPTALLGFAAASMFIDSVHEHHDLEHRHPRPERDPLRLHVGRQQQRLGVRRHHRRHDWMDTTLGIAMLVGRFFLIIPVLAIAGSLGPQAGPAGHAGHLPDPHAAVRRPGHRRRVHRRRPHLLPGTGARPHRRAALDLRSHSMETLTPTAPAPEARDRGTKRPLFEAAIVRPAIVDSFRKLDPRVQARNPVMFVVLVGSVLTTFLFIRDLGDVDRQGEPLRRPRRGLAVVHRAVRQLRRGHGRGPRQGAGGHPPQDPRRDHGPPAPRPAAASRRCRRRSSPSTTSSSCRPAR